MDFNKPLSRDEAILQNILGAQNVLSDPQSEIEAILQAILNDTPYTEEGRSRIASLLIAIKNKGVPLPELDTLNVTENGTYTAEEGHAYNEVNVDVPLPDNAYLLKDIANTPASIATFTDGSALPMPKLEVAIEPQQDLHGYDAPWIGGAGKNKLQVTATAQTINGVTFTVNSDGTVNLSGTATGTFVFPLISGTLSFSSDTIITGGYAEASASKVALRINESNLVPSEGYTISANTNITEIAIRVNSGFNTNGVKLYPMIRLSSVTDSTFAPYSNICPIIGWDEVNVTRAGKNLFDKVNCGVFNGYVAGNQVYDSINHKTIYIPCKPNTTYSSDNFTGNGRKEITYSSEVPSGGLVVPAPLDTITTDANAKYLLCYCYNTIKDTVTFDDVKNALEIVKDSTPPTTYEPYNGHTYTIPFTDSQGNPITVYGGEFDVVNGALTVDKGYIASYNGETLPSTWISDRDVYVEGTSPTTGAQVVYELATPITYQFNPTAVKSLLGSNNVWADTGKIEELEYFSKE